LAYGERGPQPATRTPSFVTEELAPTISLEITASTGACYALRQLKRALNRVSGKHSGHAPGRAINRDCYICHFLLASDQRHADQVQAVTESTCIVRRSGPAVPRRCATRIWRAVTFRADVRLNRGDKLRFLRSYLPRHLRE